MEKRDSSVADNKSMSRQESTKFKEFSLSMAKQKSNDSSKTAQAAAVFKATPLPRTTYSTHCMERKSAPPKITRPKTFNLSTERRGAVAKLRISSEEPTVKQFKSRPMPSFPDPGSPQRSTRSIAFSGK